MRVTANIPIEMYLEMEGVTPSTILERLIRLDGRMKKEIANQAGISAQRLSALINGTIRFSTKYSIGLEKALNLNIKGFFLILQAKNDIYQKKKSTSLLHKPDISKFRPCTFWDIDLNTLDWNKEKVNIINRVFEYGNKDEILELISFYGKADIKEALDNGNRARLKDVVLNRINLLNVTE